MEGVDLIQTHYIHEGKIEEGISDLFLSSFLFDMDWFSIVFYLVLFQYLP